jgi:hypothetical protein
MQVTPRCRSFGCNLRDFMVTVPASPHDRNDLAKGGLVPNWCSYFVRFTPSISIGMRLSKRVAVFTASCMSIRRKGAGTLASSNIARARPTNVAKPTSAGSFCCGVSRAVHSTLIGIFQSLLAIRSANRMFSPPLSIRRYFMPQPCYRS